MPEDHRPREVRVLSALAQQEREKRADYRRKKTITPIDHMINHARHKAPPPAASIEKIPATIEEAYPAERKKLRVAAYCRVSTSGTEQETSIIAQRQHFESIINDKPDWQFVDIYWEAGVSGTKVEKRPELQRLIADCEAGYVDLVLTKSISRFARNTTECLETVRLLMGLGVHLYFEKERIDTRYMTSDFLLTLFSSIAQEESRSISSNVKWSIQKRFMNGSFRYSKAPYGYTLSEGSFIVDPEQAKIVQEIFQRTITGEGTVVLAKDLNARGVPTGTKRRDGSPGIWSTSMILGIIKNITYTGDVLMQKTWSDSRYKRMANRGQQQQYYMDDHHEAIIDHLIFQKANAALTQRGREKGLLPGGESQQNRYAFSGKMYCALCGGKLKRITVARSTGKHYYWGCAAHLRSAAECRMKREHEESLINAFITMLNKLAFAPVIDVYIQMLLQEEHAWPGEPDGSIALQDQHADEDRKRRMHLLSKGYADPVPFHRWIVEQKAEEATLQNEKDQLLESVPMLQEAMTLKAVVNAWRDHDTKETPEELFERFVERAVVHTGENVVFCLKCGLELRESLCAEEEEDGTLRIHD